MKTLFGLLLICSIGFGQPDQPAAQKTVKRLPQDRERAVPPDMTTRAAARFLDQATWGPTPASIEALRKEGIENWLAAQFTATPSDIPDQALLNSAGQQNTGARSGYRGVFPECADGSRSIAAARRVHALADLGSVAGVGASGVRVPAVLAYLPR